MLQRGDEKPRYHELGVPTPAPADSAEPSVLDIVRRLKEAIAEKDRIITERTRAHYGMWVNLDELVAEGDRMVGDEVAEEGIRSLKEINAGKRKVVRRISG